MIDKPIHFIQNQLLMMSSLAFQLNKVGVIAFYLKLCLTF